MPAAKYDFTLEQGATFEYTLTWVNEAGSPENLTGYSARLQARLGSSETTEAAIDLDSELLGGITLGDALGTIDILIDAVTTAAIAPGKYVYDLELINVL